MSQCAWWGHHSWCQLPWHHQHSPMEDGWFRDATQTPTPPRAVAGGTTLPCQPVPCSCTELQLPSQVCAPSAAALPSLPSQALSGLTLPTPDGAWGAAPKPPASPLATLSSRAQPTLRKRSQGDSEPELPGSFRILWPISQTPGSHQPGLLAVPGEGHILSGGFSDSP